MFRWIKSLNKFTKYIVIFERRALSNHPKYTINFGGFHHQSFFTNFDPNNKEQKYRAPEVKKYPYWFVFGLGIVACQSYIKDKNSRFFHAVQYGLKDELYT